MSKPNDPKRPSAIEYGLMAALIAVASIAAMKALKPPIDEGLECILIDGESGPEQIS